MKIYLDNAHYFITCPTSLHKPLLGKDIYKKIVFDKIGNILENFNLPNLAISVQNDHYHFLTKVDCKEKISKLINLINGGSSHHINKLEQINRRFWGNYWMKIVEDEAILNKIIGYIVGNPLKHGIIKNFEELKNYPHCTFNKFVETRDMATAEEFIRSVIKLKF